MINTIGMERTNLFISITVLSISYVIALVSQGYSETSSNQQSSGLVLVPTAPADDRSHIAINVDVLFTYFIGEMFGEVRHQFDYFEPLRTWVLSGDVKWRFKRENARSPALALGALGSSLMTAQGIGPNSPLEFAGEWLGSLYLVGSKSLGNYRVHLGFMWGSIPQILNFLSPDISLDSPNTIFLGFDTRIFGQRRISVEALLPSSDSYLIDLHVDRFLSFDFAFLKIPEGYSVIGFYNFRVGLFPPKKEENHDEGYNLFRQME